jgi:hypothetical protein
MGFALYFLLLAIGFFMLDDAIILLTAIGGLLYGLFLFGNPIEIPNAILLVFIAFNAYIMIYAFRKK